MLLVVDCDLGVVDPPATHLDVAFRVSLEQQGCFFLRGKHQWLVVPHLCLVLQQTQNLTEPGHVDK